MVIERSQRAIGRFFWGFPAGSLPSPPLLPNLMLKSLIAADFSVWRELEKFFTLSFPMRQGKYEGARPYPPPPKPAFATGSVDPCWARGSTAMPHPSYLKVEAIEAGIDLDRDLATESLFERT